MDYARETFHGRKMDDLFHADIESYEMLPLADIHQMGFCVYDM